MIKVCHVITKLELGGAQDNTIFTVSNLDKKKYDVFLVCGRGGVLDNETKNKVRTIFVPFLVRSINPLYDLVALFSLWKIFIKERPEIVHTHSSKAGILARLAAYLANVRIIIHTYHGFGFNEYQRWFVRKFFIFLERLIARITDILICVSKENVKKALNNKIGIESQYKIIHSGIRITEFRKKVDNLKVKRKLGIPIDASIVGMVSCFKPQKAPLDFIYLADRLINEGVNVYFVLVGDGLLRKKIEGVTRKKHLETYISLLGWRRDIVEIMSIFDIFVLTSLWEGLPRVVLEAMILKKPVVATDVDGVREVILHGKNGFLVAPHDISTMKEYVLKLLRDKRLAQEMGDAGFSKVDKRFNIEYMVVEIDSLYQEMIKSEAKWEKHW